MASMVTQNSTLLLPRVELLEQKSILFCSALLYGQRLDFTTQNANGRRK